LQECEKQSHFLVFQQEVLNLRKSLNLHDQILQ